MADLDRKDTNQTDGNYTAQSKNVDSVNIGNYDSNDYQPYLHDSSHESASNKTTGNQTSSTQSNDNQVFTNSQTQESVVLDRSQVNNYTQSDYQSVSNNQAAQTNMNVTDGFKAGDTDTNSYREETAAEIAAPVTLNRRKTSDNADVKEGGGAIGLSALALSILSLFVFPVLFGGAGIILGFIARGRGSATGTWAITIGAISLILGIFILPFF